MNTVGQSLDDDGLATPEVGKWAIRKYKLVKGYSQVFASSMKNRWKHRVYIDLFAGAGRARLKGTQSIIETSALLALRIPCPFDHYVFCDKDPCNLEALKERSAKINLGDCRKHYLRGDSNQMVEEIARCIPNPSRGNSVLSFCFVDPFRLDHLKFNTLRLLSKFYVDFLVLIPTGMDARRNESQYFNSTSRKVDHFIDNPNWRSEWESLLYTQSFGTFIVNQFNARMRDLQYLEQDLSSTQMIKNHKGRELYQLAFYSRHDLGNKFWKDVKRLSNPQMSLV